jgi:hypothetical protein
MTMSLALLALAGTLMQSALSPATASEYTDSKVLFQSVSSLLIDVSDGSTQKQIAISDRQGAKIQTRDYVDSRSSCAVNSMSRVSRRNEVVVDWRCGPYRAIKKSDIVAINVEGENSIFSDAVIVPVGSK